MKLIVTGVDGSPSSTAAVHEAVELARATGASLLFVGAHHPVVHGGMFATPVLTDNVTTAAAAVADAIAVAEEADVRATGSVVEGLPGDEILHAAELRDAQLIIVGCRGHGAVASAFLGSVSRWLLSHSNIPVLVVKERAPVVAAR